MNQNVSNALEGNALVHNVIYDGAGTNRKENSKSTKTQNKQINIEDVEDHVKEEEKHNLSDSNILQYNVPSFGDKKILGKIILLV